MSDFVVLSYKLTPDRFIRSPFVTVYVGHEKKDFKIYKDLLCAESPFFASKLKDEWSNGQYEVSLEEEDPEAFEAITNFMFTGKFGSLTVGKTTNLSLFSSVYKLAGFLMITKAQNELISMLFKYVQQTSTIFNFTGLCAIWAADPQETLLFRMVLRSSVECYATNHVGQPPYEGLGNHSELMSIIIEAMGEFSKNRWEFLKSSECDYHDHSDGSSCST